MNVFIDANVFIFALLDDSNAGEKAKSLLDEVSRGKMQGVTSVLVIDEVMWALVRNKQAHLIEQYVKNIYEQPNLQVAGVGPNVAMLAVQFMKKYGLKPRDAMHCAFMEIEGISAIVSDDKDFDAVKEIKRLSI